MEQKKILFNLPVFIVAFSIGLLYVYLFTPHKQIILKYPNPYNANNLVYRDANDDNICYKYKSTKVKCPEDKSKILDHQVTV